MGRGTSGRLGGRTIGRSDDAVCDPHHTHGGDEEHGFRGLASKPVASVWWFGPQNHCDGFLVWASKPRRERRFVGLRLKTDGWMKTVWRHASISGGLLRSEVSRARVSQFGVKTGSGVAADGAHGIIAAKEKMDGSTASGAARGRSDQTTP